MQNPAEVSLRNMVAVRKKVNSIWLDCVKRMEKTERELDILTETLDLLAERVNQLEKESK